jgi:hypothetical protein
VPTRSLPSNPSLEHLRNEAKRLLRQVRAGERGAIRLVRELHPRLAGDGHVESGFTLADAQLVVARGYRFASWPKLVRHVEVVVQFTRSPHRQSIDAEVNSQADLVDQFLRLACLNYGADDDARPARARELLEAHPEVATATIHTIAAAGEVEAARELLARDRSLADKQGGPFAWEPILYLAYARLGAPSPGRSSVATARLLLEHGADPNAGYLWEGLTSPFTALTGAFGGGEGDQPPHPDELALARMLLEAGADPNDSQAIYNRSWSHDDGWLELLLEFGLGHGSGGPWHTRLGDAHPTPKEDLEDELRWAVANDLPDRVRLLVRHGVDVDGLGTNHPVLRGRSALELAERDGSAEIVELLRSVGATPPQLDPVDEFAAGAMRADRPIIERLLADDPTLRERAIARHPGLIIRAAELGRRPTVRLLVELGFDIDLLQRGTALHEAAWRDDVAMVELLLELGADTTITDLNHHSTPLGWAQYGGRSKVEGLLSTLEGVER